jgi:hypothetical protein
MSGSQVCSARNPQMVFEVISGAGAGPNARQMWRRVKGAAEEALLAMRLHDVYTLQSGFIQLMQGSTTRHGDARPAKALTRDSRRFRCRPRRRHRPPRY